ncbi:MULTISPECIES: hypothetical protein [Streptomyces]|uniref:Lipoprotein n=1 Tax=Streptomyces xanthii TaxID=2768069 RepID=A0A7H1B4Z2_9ACTN|nr:hypothetical protein [Streptomyces xanthii]QNS03797.1 hypothetical protein IAG42_09255 [Streptomyces xanthii]
MPHIPQVPPGPRRRTLLASLAGASALLTACSGGGDGTEGGSGAPSVSQERRMRTQAARDSADLLGRYDDALTARPGLAGRLGPLRAETERHVQAFGGAAVPSRMAGAPAPTASPVAEKDVLKALAAAERELSDRRLAALVDAPAELARLLASVAAAGAAHAYLLTEG